MSDESFQLIDNETADNWIVKSDLLKIYHQRRANSDNFDKNIDFSSTEKSNHKFGNTYLQYEMTTRKKAAHLADCFSIDDDAYRLVNIAFVY